jgi:hypothetical protein
VGAERCEDTHEELPKVILQVETWLAASPLTFPTSADVSQLQPKARRPFGKLRAGFGTAGRVPALPSRHHGLGDGHRIDPENESIDLANDDAFSGRDFDGGNGVPKFAVDEDLARG